MKINTFAVLISIVVLSCISNRKHSGIREIDFTLIAKNNLYGDGNEGLTKQNKVITDKSTWEQLITQMNSVNNVSDDFSETEIDFSQYTVIVIIDEIRGSGGYSLDLDIKGNQDSMLVNVTHVEPEGTSTSEITQPFYIVKVEKNDSPVIFK